MSVTLVDQLDLAEGVGQRQATFRFDLVDGPSGRPLGELHPDTASVPALSHDTTRTVSRTLTGIDLDAAETADLDPLSMRVRPVMLIGGDEFPLGTYVFTDQVKAVSTAGRQGTHAAADLMLVVAQPTETTVAFAAGTNTGAAITSVLAAVAGLAGFVVAASPIALGSPIAWPAGTDRAKIVADLATLGGYLAPWMGNDSQIHVIRTFDPADEPATFVFDTGGRVLARSITETTDIIEAPNRFIVVDNSNTDSAVVGVYDIPVAAPHSFANRGFIVAHTSNIQGSGTPVNAASAAETLGRQQGIVGRASMSTPPDPRHDSYDVVRFDGVNWMEVAWSMGLREGAEMTHTLRRAYSVTS